MPLKKNQKPLSETHPYLAAQINPRDNNGLTADDITAGSSLDVVWNQLHFDRKQKKWFRFKWVAKVYNRVAHPSCPFLTGRKVWPGYNDIKTTHPEVAALMHPTKNGNLTPEQLSAGCRQKIVCLLPHDDPVTGKHFDLEWEASVQELTRGSGCPYLSGKKVLRGFNDLATTNPKVAADWDYENNGDITPFTITASCNYMASWVRDCYNPYTGKMIKLKWKARVFSRTSGTDCPYLSGQKALKGFNSLSTTHPHLMAEWDWEKNKNVSPDDVTACSKKEVYWKCANGHSWPARIYHRSAGEGCPYCKVSKGEKKITNFLRARNIPFKSEYTFDDCVHKDKLRFDSAIFDKKGSLAFLVEYDGEQHYKPVDFSGKGNGTNELKINQARDKIKTDYCRQRRIPLVRISYKDYDNIEHILLKTLIRYNLVA